MQFIDLSTSNSSSTVNCYFKLRYKYVIQPQSSTHYKMLFLLIYVGITGQAALRSYFQRLHKVSEVINTGATSGLSCVLSHYQYVLGNDSVVSCILISTPGTNQLQRKIRVCHSTCQVQKYNSCYYYNYCMIKDNAVAVIFCKSFHRGKN